MQFAGAVDAHCQQHLNVTRAARSRNQSQYGSDPLADHANLTLITGPSRTGDIEMLLTVGIHGPGELHIVLLDEGVAAQKGASQ